MITPRARDPRIKAEDVAQSILDKFGCLVVGSYEEWNIGEVAPFLMGSNQITGLRQKTVIIGHATYSEYVEQVRFAGINTGMVGHTPYYYKVVAE